jgi:hypothetical protein
MTWLPEWRVTVGDDVYTTVTSVSFASGRLDIDRQCTAGYCQVEIINTDNSPFTINVTEPITLELKNSSGTYVTVFGGEVSDFNIGVRSPEEIGYVTTGKILGIGSMAKLTKAVYNTALIEELDGEQIADILGQALNLSWHRGARTVLLLGYDMQHTGGKAHCHADHPRPLGNFAPEMARLCATKFDAIASDLKNECVRVINCTRETALRCFERMPLAEALASI